MRRPNPCQLVFGETAAPRFEGIAAGVAGRSADPSDRDAFFMVKEAVELLRELRPDTGLGDAVGTMAAFLHQSYLYWMGGQHTRVLSDAELARALATDTDTAVSSGPGSRYVQLPALHVWGVPVEGAPAEPLDGWFESRKGDQLSMLAIFGLYPGRDGFTGVEVAGSRPRDLARPDGSALFHPALPGGAAAGLASVTGAEELLELAWRIPV